MTDAEATMTFTVTDGRNDWQRTYAVTGWADRTADYSSSVFRPDRAVVIVTIKTRDGRATRYEQVDVSGFRVLSNGGLSDRLRKTRTYRDPDKAPPEVREIYEHMLASIGIPA